MTTPYKVYLSKCQVKNIKDRVSAEEGKRLDEMIAKGEIKVLGAE